MIFNPWVLLGALVSAIALAAGGYYYGGKHADAAWKVTIAAQKLEAAQKLADVIRLNGIKEESDRKRAITNQVDYDNSLKALVDSNRKYAGQLRDPGRRASSSCPASQGSASPNAVEVVPVDSRISDEAGAFLRSITDEADQLAIWGKSCFDFVNKK